jgi:hypothetical protein
MTINAIAARIPAEYRKEILETNMISRATASAADPSMSYLMNIWQTYVEPFEIIDMGCGFCKERILGNYRQLQPVLITLEKDSNLLKSLP